MAADQPAAAKAVAALTSLSTTGLVRAVLIVSFAVALLLGAGSFYAVLHQRAVCR